MRSTFLILKRFLALVSGPNVPSLKLIGRPAGARPARQRERTVAPSAGE
jgi:hypothetical protein